MKAFTDNAGRLWEIELNVRQMKRVRDRLGVDLVNVISAGEDGSVATDTLDRVANDPILLCDILWVLCEGQAKTAGVTDDDFGSSLAGDSISEATRAAVGLARRYEEENAAALEKALESPEFEERMKTLLNPRGGSPGSAESTPAPSP